MKWKELLNKIDYTTRGDLLLSLEESEVTQILKDYYIDGKSLSDVSSKYLDYFVSTKHFRQSFPKVVGDDLCQQCGHKMIFLLPIKAELNELLKQELSYKCSQCSHQNDYVDCLCIHCEEEKRNEIDNVYDIEEALAIEDLNLRDRLDLATILQGFNITIENDEIMSFKEYNSNSIDTPLFTSKDYPLKEIEKLYDKKILRVSPKSDIDAFVPLSKNKDFPNRFYPSRTKYSLKNLKLNFQNNPDWFNYFKYPKRNIEIDTKVINLWYEIAIIELTKMFNKLFYEHHLEYVSDEEGLEKEKQLLKDTLS